MVLPDPCCALSHLALCLVRIFPQLGQPTGSANKRTLEGGREGGQEGDFPTLLLQARHGGSFPHYSFVRWPSLQNSLGVRVPVSLPQLPASLSGVVTALGICTLERFDVPKACLHFVSSPFLKFSPRCPVGVYCLLPAVTLTHIHDMGSIKHLPEAVSFNPPSQEFHEVGVIPPYRQRLSDLEKFRIPHSKITSQDLNPGC